MNFGESIKTCFTKYADFSGTASRSEYWYFALFAFICYFAAFALDVAANTPVFFLLLVLGFLIPGLAVGARRLRDAGMSPYLLFLELVPFFGSLALIVLFCQPSKAKQHFQTPNQGIQSNFVPQYSAHSSQAKFCTKCGTAATPGQRYCPACGQLVQ